MKKYVFPLVAGILVWMVATLFFVIFGDEVLFSPDSEQFLNSYFLLILGTALLILAVTYLYLVFDRSEHASLSFGLVGTMIGLILDTFSISNHRFMFPKLDSSQMITFTAWMAFAYALYLLIPTFIYLRRGRQISSKELHGL